MGTRFVAVGNKLIYSKKIKTFHDFLGHNMGRVFGQEWGNEELKKSLEERHPVCVWYHYVCQHQKNFMGEAKEIYSAPNIGATSAWFHLAYDLFCLEHNAELQAKLIARLKNNDGFRGARYEVFVAAAMIRAGFDIEFENEEEAHVV